MEHPEWSHSNAPPPPLGWEHWEEWCHMCTGTCSESIHNSVPKLLFFKHKSMIIQIKMNIKCNHAIIKYFKSNIAVIISVNKKSVKKGLRFATIFQTQTYSIMYLELVGSAHVRNNGSGPIRLWHWDYPTVILLRLHTWVVVPLLHWVLKNISCTGTFMYICVYMHILYV